MSAVMALLLARAFASGEALPTRHPLPEECKAAFDRAKRTLEAKLGERVAVTLELEPGGQAAVRDDLFSHWVSLLDRKRKVLVVDTARLETLLAKAKTTRQRADGLFVLMLHELIHAYQDQVLATYPKPTVNGK